MFCRNCGRELTEGSETCTGCGTRPPGGNSFCQACGAVTTTNAKACDKCGVELAKLAVEDFSPKSRTITSLLAFFLGIFGAHRFYLGKNGTAVGMLALAILGLAPAKQPCRRRPAWWPTAPRRCCDSDGIGVSPRANSLIVERERDDGKTSTAVPAPGEDRHRAAPPAGAGNSGQPV